MKDAGLDRRFALIAWPFSPRGEGGMFAVGAWELKGVLAMRSELNGPKNAPQRVCGRLIRHDRCEWPHGEMGVIIF